MARELALGNGEFLVNLDSGLNIRDLYYPLVGLYNHVGGYRCRVGVWTSDAGFAWLDNGDWDRKLSYRPGTLVSDCQAHHSGLKVSLRIEHCVPPGRPLFLQRLVVKNLADDNREIRIFFAADLRIAESDIGDTAFYNPYLQALVHYKRDFYFLISGYAGEDPDLAAHGIEQYACGIKEFGGAEGCWRDAEDGDLSNNAIAQGSVDSVVGFPMFLPAFGQSTLRLWLAAGRGLPAVAAVHSDVLNLGFDLLMHETEIATIKWAGTLPPGQSKLPRTVASLFNRSLLVMRTQIDKGGAIVASTDSDIMQTARAHYAYMWPRDGALAANALDRVGLKDVSRSFYEFCVRLIAASPVQNGKGAAFMHKYGPDGTLGASWHPWVIHGSGAEIPIQEDGTALVVWAFGNHFERFGEKGLADLYQNLMCPAAEFLVQHRDSKTKLPQPSWDIWEERRGVHLYTTSVAIAALRKAASVANALGDEKKAALFQESAEEMTDALVANFWDEKAQRFARMLTRDSAGNLIRDLTLDSSAYAVFAFGALPVTHPGVIATMHAIGRALWVKTAVGGLARYERDYYFRITDDFAVAPGNPWIICTLWLAEWGIATAKKASDLQPALELLEWVSQSALPTGVLSEQVHPFTHEALSVAPLTWSHAQFVTTTLNYLERLQGFEK
jgi:GH15 family glucan-1,4-alpha-glucosidase